MLIYFLLSSTVLGLMKIPIHRISTPPSIQDDNLIPASSESLSLYSKSDIDIHNFQNVIYT
jgi:hypothetical protein